MAWNTNRKQRLPSNWQRGIRPRILNRDPICRHCGQAPSVEVHHLRDGNDHSDTNLIGLCSSCHNVETQKEAAQARAKHPSLRRPAEQHPGMR